jgi:hypothetical protein
MQWASCMADTTLKRESAESFQRKENNMAKKTDKHVAALHGMVRAYAEAHGLNYQDIILSIAEPFLLQLIAAKSPKVLKFAQKFCAGVPPAS